MSYSRMDEESRMRDDEQQNADDVWRHRYDKDHKEQQQEQDDEQ